MYDDLNELIEQLGGKTKVAKILDKNRGTIYRWLDPDSMGEIDKANYIYLKNEIYKQNFLNDNDVINALQELPIDVLLNEIKRRTER